MDAVAICNLALSWLGENPITSLDDESDSASICKENYGPLRDAVLESAEWSFAVARYRRTAVDDSSDPYWSRFEGKRYLLPDDVLRVISVYRNPGMEEFDALEHEQEDRHLVLASNWAHDAIYIKAIRRVEDPNRFSPSFVQALAERLAWDLAIPVTNSPDIENAKGTKYAVKVTDATALNGIRQTSKQIRSSWLLRRRNRGA